MLVCFDKNGVLKEQLDSYGNLPRVGSQLFKIFAYFKDVDLTNYGAAYIKLQRPDLSDSEYPVLFMMQVDLTYNPSIIAPSVSNYFSANGGPNDDDTYPCYLFDFSTIVDTMKTQTTDDDQIVTLLDTPGQWQATITLISTVTGASNVVGTISFNVGGAVSSEQETQIDFDIVTHNIATIIATKLESKSTYYVRSMDGFETAADDGTLPKSIFSYPNLTVWDRTEKALYLITNLDDGIDDDHYSATYTKIVDLDDKLNISEGILVVPNISLVNLTPYVTGQLFYSLNDGTYYRKNNIGNPEKVENVGILGARNALVRYVVPDDGTDIKIGDIPFLTDGSEKSVVVNFQSHDYILQASNLDNGYCDVIAFDPFEQCFYLGSNIGLIEDWFSDLISDNNRIDHVIRKYDTNTVYGVDAGGNQVNFRIDDLFDGYIKYYQVPNYQTTVSMITDILTNINGLALTDFNYNEITVNSKPAYQIIDAVSEENLTEEEAADYMKAMTGSEYVPEYDLNSPSNSFMMLPDGTLLKPQWDNSRGLVLYKLQRFADVEYVNNNILSIPNPSGTYGVLTDEQYAYVLTKNARVLNTSTGVYYEKCLESSSQILFKAIDINFVDTSGTVTLTNTSALNITKSNKRYAFGPGPSKDFYSKSKLDADFATKQYVLNTVSDLKRNSFIVVDTTEYPTLNDFLASEGEEGYIYLYPVVVQQEVTDRGYYQYIWEDVDLGDNVDEAGWFCIGTTQIDLSNFEITFEQESFNDGAVSVTFANNTDYQLISLIDTVTVTMIIPSGVTQGWVSSCTFTVGNSIPTFSLTNNSSYNVVFIVNNRKADVSAIALNLDRNGIVECMAECNGFDIRIYMKEVTN